jgi:hypothetical protein
MSSGSEDLVKLAAFMLLRGLGVFILNQGKGGVSWNLGEMEDLRTGLKQLLYGYCERGWRLAP